MSLTSRLIRGTPHRRTRLHDEKGNRVDAGGLVYLPLTLLLAVLRVTAGWRPEWPLIGFRAMPAVAALLDPGSRVVEFGSGLSTPWLARRCGFLLSIEDDPAWYARVQARLARHGFTHVRHELRGPESYADLSDFRDGFFDFALIDGSARAACVAAVLPKLRAGGWVYLDNADKDMTRPDGDLRRAEAALLAAARGGGSVHHFTDFAPGNAFAEQGLLVRPAAPAPDGAREPT